MSVGVKGFPVLAVALNIEQNSLGGSRMPKRILIADDNDTVREIVKLQLCQKVELEACDEAANGREAIERAQQNKPDLIILDLAMPGLNGLEAAKILKTTMPNVPIVLFTMYNLGPQAAELGVDAIVSKPDGLSALAACVQSLLTAVA